MISALLMLPLASSRYYEATVSSDGMVLSTGLRQSSNTSLDLEGFAAGKGMYYRYVEVVFNDVKAKERIAAEKGTMEMAERMRLIAEASDVIEVNLYKFPETQTYSFTVNETWPVALSARRSINYAGLGISDREVFNNNQDYVSTFYLRSPDLQKNRALYMDLRNAYFDFAFNDTAHRVLKDRFLPAKTTIYRLESLSRGTAILSYRQASDHNASQESYESYTGSFKISRGVTMESSGRNFTSIDDSWLPCCDPWAIYQGPISDFMR